MGRVRGDTGTGYIWAASVLYGQMDRQVETVLD